MVRKGGVEPPNAWLSTKQVCQFPSLAEKCAQLLYRLRMSLGVALRNRFAPARERLVPLEGLEPSPLRVRTAHDTLTPQGDGAEKE
jgi:hypothetical protein